MISDSLKKKGTTKWIVLLSSIPILIFFYTFFQFTSNIPFQDDYDALLEPVTKFTQLAHFSWSEFVKIVWAQDDERRIVVDRIVAIITYCLINKLDLSVHGFLGLLSLLGIFYLFYTIIRDAKLPMILLLVCSLLLFHIQYYETIFWAMIPLQHILVYFFALLSFYFLYSTKPSHLFISLLAAVFAILSDISGTFILPVGILLLLVQHRWKFSVVWLLVIGGMVWLYYHDFAIPSYRPKLSENIQHPDFIIGRFLVASGLSFDPDTVFPPILRICILMAVGAILWATVIYYGFKLIIAAFGRSQIVLKRWEVTLWGGLFQVGITLLALAVGRAVEGIDPLLISRYKHIGFIWLILIILLVASKLNQQILFSKIWLSISIVLFIFSYFQYLPSVDYYYKERYTDSYEWEYNRAIPSTPIYIRMRSGVDTMMVQAIRAGVYQLPAHYFFAKPYQEKNNLFPLKASQAGGHTLLFSNDTFSKKFSKYDGAFLLLKSASQTHIIPTKQNRYSLRSFIFSLGDKYYANGFKTSLVNQYLLNDQLYRVCVLVINGDEKNIYNTNILVQTRKNVVKILTQ